MFFNEQLADLSFLLCLIDFLGLAASCEAE